jgi:glycosyltransferase involved in cell wall biosynthesis
VGDVGPDSDATFTRCSESSVTVVIPVYNGEDFLERAVRSAANQTHPQTRVLVINDGSTDASAVVLDRLVAELQNVRYVTIPNGGVANARNKGIALADTAYVAFLDADDIWHPTKIAKQVAALQRHAGDDSWAACYTLFRRIDADDRLFDNGPLHAARGDIFLQHLRCNHVGNGSNLLVRRDAALAIGGFDSSYAARRIGGCEDFDFQLRLLKRYKLEVVPEYLIGYRLHDGCMSRNHRAMALGYLATIESALDDPRVTKRIRRKALGSAHDFAWWRLVRSGSPGAGMRSLLAYLRVYPIAGVPRIGFRLLRLMLNLFRRPFRETARRRKPFFVQLDAKDATALEIGQSRTSELGLVPEKAVG